MLAWCASGACAAQSYHPAPVTDSSTESSPTGAAPPVATVDGSTEASPVAGRSHTSSRPRLAPDTRIPLQLGEAIDSGKLQNGAIVRAHTTAPIASGAGITLPVGTPVQLTVIGTVPAGVLSAAGEFSLQATRVGGAPVFTDTQTFRGKAGHRDLPDSAAATGTDAGLPAGAALTFIVQPQPAFATEPPAPRPPGTPPPGSVDGTASGAPPPAGAAQRAQKTAERGAAGTSGAKSVTPADTTPSPAQHIGQASPAPNEPAAPQGTGSTDTTQPH